MKQDNIYSEVLPRLHEGIRKASSITNRTMGPRGKNVILQSNLLPKHLETNDGATIIDAIELADPIESIGLSYLKEAVARSNSNAGDGSSTTACLVDAIVEEGIKTGISTMDIKYSLDECLPIIEASLRDQTKEITVKDIKSVALIAGEDEKLAEMLQEIYEKIGKDGIIHLDNSGTYDTSYSLIEGVRFVDTGYLSPYMIHDHKTKAIYKNPTILVTKNKIGHINDINPLLAALEAQNKKDLIIFTDDMDSGVARILIEAHTKGMLDILIIKAPTLWKSYVFEDFAKCVGATIIEDSSGTKLGKEMQLGWLGTCETLICDKEEVALIGIKDISDHIEALKQEDSTESKRRLSWLTTQTAILKLGAQSETELSYKRLKAEDAVWSSRAALHDGIVPGGGVALRNAANLMLDTIGGRIMAIALRAPIKQIIANTGAKDIYSDSSYPETKGFNAANGDFVDMFEAGIVDSVSIVRNAVRNSLGIVSLLLTACSVITLPQKSTEEMFNQSMMRPMQGL